MKDMFFIQIDDNGISLSSYMLTWIDPSLKQTNEALWKSFICGNGNVTSLLFNSVINLFDVIRSIAITSLIKLPLTLAA